MGVDIYTHVERCNEAGKWEKVPDMEPFDWRDYGLYGWLADVRNYSAIPPIAEQRWIPDDASPEVREEFDADWERGCYGASWLSVRELADFDYSQELNDRRITRQTGPNAFDSGATGSPEEGTITTYRKFLGDAFMRDLESLQELGNPDRVRVVFWFG